MGKGKKKVSFKPVFKVDGYSTSDSGKMANSELLLYKGGDVEVLEVEEGLENVGELNQPVLSEKESVGVHKMSDEKPSTELNNSSRAIDKGPYSEKFKANSFAEIVKNSREPYAGFQLLFEETQDEAVRILPEEIVDVGSKFGYALIGFFPTRHPGKIGMDKLTSSWEVPVRVIPNVNGWITFIFKTACDRDIVLGGGPYSVFGRSLLLRTMPKWFKFGEDEIDSIPIWTKFPNLPLECWNAKLISRIASKVGRPLMTDKLTTTMERISYARVLIDIDVTKDFVRTIPIIDSNGNKFEQMVEFENEPKYCTICRNIGHYSVHCRKNESREDEPVIKDKELVKLAPAVHQKQPVVHQKLPLPKPPSSPRPAAVNSSPAASSNRQVGKENPVSDHQKNAEGIFDCPASSSSKSRGHQSVRAEGLVDCPASSSRKNAEEGSSDSYSSSGRKNAEKENSSLHTDETELVPITEVDQFQLVGKGNRKVKPKANIKIKLKDQLYRKQEMERASLGKRAGSK